MEQGKMSVAIKILHEINDYANMIGHKAMKASTNGRLGAIYFKTGKKDKALEYYEKQEGIYREINDVEGVKRSVGNQIFIKTNRAPTTEEMMAAVKDMTNGNA